MPSWNLFEAQDESYRESVIPRSIKKRVTVEAASPIGWHRWTGDEGAVIGVERFGASAPGQDVLTTWALRQITWRLPPFGSSARTTRPIRNTHRSKLGDGVAAGALPHDLSLTNATDCTAGITD